MKTAKQLCIAAAKDIAIGKETYSCCALGRQTMGFTGPASKGLFVKEYRALYEEESDYDKDAFLLQLEEASKGDKEEAQHLRVMLLLFAAEVL